MREILFKAKRVDNGEWIAGYFYTQLGTNYIAKWDSHLCVYGFGNLGAPAFFEILPETLCQFTGLHDKNGNRIFEGDIIRKGFECFVVKWNSNQCRWGLFDKHDFEVSGFNEHTQNYLEIIGNIHDNPELLTAERIEDK